MDDEINKPPQPAASEDRENQSDRRFRRYHAAQLRRRKAEMADERFSRAVFSVAGIGAAIAIALGVVAMNGVSLDPESATRLTEPWVLGLSRMEIYGLCFIALLAGMFLWRIRKR